MTASERPVEPYEGNEPYIFISYSHQDKERVFPILRKMKDAGYRFWYDEGIDPGSEWPESIAMHLEGSSCFIAFISMHSLDSRNCRREINFALSREKEFLSVIMEPVKMSPGVEMQISTYQSLLYYKYNDADEVIRRLGKLAALAPCQDLTVQQAPPQTNPNQPSAGPSVPSQMGTVTSAAGQGETTQFAANQGGTVHSATNQEGPAQSDANQRGTAQSDANPSGTEQYAASQPHAEQSAANQAEASLSSEGASSRKTSRFGKSLRKAAANNQTTKKKFSLKRLFVALLAAAAVIGGGLWFYLAKPLLPRMTLNGKTYEDTSTSMILRDSTIDQEQIRKLARFKKLTQLTLENCTLPENVLTDLSGMTQLKKLSISGCGDLSEVSALGKLTNLTILELCGCGLSDEEVSSIPVSENLYSLSLNDNMLTQLPSLPVPEKISYLSLQGNQLTSLKDIKALTGLEKLDVSDNQLTDLGGIEGAEKLSRLTLGNNQLTDISPLSSLIYLTELDLSGNSIEDVSALGNCTILVKLDLSGNTDISDISFIAKNQETLKQLNLSGITLGDDPKLLQIIAGCGKLTKIGLDGCGLSDLSLLSACPDLSWISASGNELTDFSGLEQCMQLTYLNVSDNQLTSFTGFPTIQNASEYMGIDLLAHQNQLTDVSGVTVDKIRLLSLSDNPLTEFTGLEKSEIRNYILEINADTNYYSLPVKDYWTNLFVTDIPADRRVEFEEYFKKNDIEYTDTETALTQLADRTFTFS